MGAKDRRRIRAVLHEARGVPHEQREAAIKSACNGDDELERAVLSLVEREAPAWGGEPQASGLIAGANETTLSEAVPRDHDVQVPGSGTLVEARYRLGERLGAGAHGVVFAAHDLIEDRDVALKWVRLTHQRQVERYGRELAALRRARVPGVVELLDDGVFGPWSFLVMELIQGQPFPGQVAQGADTRVLLARIASFLCAVCRLHTAGVLHRDLKPTNVLVRDCGEVTIVDLGIAQEEAESHRIGRTPRVMGTPLYLAPERRGGGRATVQSDLYAAGVTVAEAFGRVCASEEGGRLEAARAVNAGVESIRQQPGAVRRLLLSLLEGRPEDRPVSAGHVLAMLDEQMPRAREVVLPSELAKRDRWEESDIRGLIQTSNRIFSTRDQLTSVLWSRSRGRSSLVRRELEAWCAAGLATWERGLVVTPRALQRILSSPAFSIAILPTGVLAKFDSDAWEVWNLLTLAETGLRVRSVGSALECEDPSLALIKLRDAGAVATDACGLAWALVPSPGLSSVEPDLLVRWSRRLAASLPADSGEVYALLTAAGLHIEACRSALLLARAHSRNGRNDRARAVLGSALTTARRWMPDDHGLYDQLMAQMATVAVSVATRASIDAARYHLEMAPHSTGATRCWGELLAAAARVLGGDPRGALTQLDALASLPSDPHCRLFHVISNLAVRRVGGPEEMRERLRAAARWVRSSPSASSRSLFAAWTGWLRFHEGAFGRAMAGHARSARLAPGGRARTTALCNAASAAIEAGDLESATVLAQTALRAARLLRDPVNLARAERTARIIAYRLCQDLVVDEDLLAATEGLARAGPYGLTALAEAAIAWRAVDLERGAQLAEIARVHLGSSGLATASFLAVALAASCGDSKYADLQAALHQNASEMEPRGIAAQGIALAAMKWGLDAISPVVVKRAREWARMVPHPAMRREVLSPNEVSMGLGEGD